MTTPPPTAAPLHGGELFSGSIIIPYRYAVVRAPPRKGIFFKDIINYRKKKGSRAATLFYKNECGWYSIRSFVIRYYDAPYVGIGFSSDSGSPKSYLVFVLDLLVQLLVPALVQPLVLDDLALLAWVDLLVLLFI